MDVTTSETSSSLLFLDFIFYQCFKTFLIRRMAFCFYMLKETFLLRRKKNPLAQKTLARQLSYPIFQNIYHFGGKQNPPKCTGFPVSDWLIHSSW